MKNKILSVLLVLVMTMALAAPAFAQSETHFVGYSCMTFEDAYLVSTGNKIHELCDARGYQYTEMGAEGVAAKQVEQIENMVTMGCDIICVCPIDVDALLDVFTRARTQGVSIIYCGDPLGNKDSFDAAVNVSQYNFGVSAAQAAADWIDATYPDAEAGSIEVAVFVNSSNDLFQRRAEGLQTLPELNPKAKIVEVYDLVGQQNSGAKCQEFADALFLNHPDCKVILSHSADYATSIDEVIMRTAGLKAEDLGIFACDWLEAAAQSIVLSAEDNSTIRAIVDSGDLGESMFKVAVKELPVDENGFAQMELTTVTIDNVAEAIELHK